MIDYSSMKTAAEKFAALKEAAGKKPTPKLNPIFYYQFSNRFMHFLDINKYRAQDTCISSLLSKQGKVVTNDFTGTLIDISDNNDTISYVETDRLVKLFMEEKVYTEKNNTNFSHWFNNIVCKDPEMWKLHKTEIKAGRFLKRFFNYSDRTCEDFANLYKSYNDSFNYEFEIVGGEDIIKYYNKDNYDIVNGNSSLNKSCMAYFSSDDVYMKRNGGETVSDRLRFYSLNPNCAMLILRKKKSKKIKGRCLLWKTINNGIYMDRVYVDFESDFYLYKKYATDNNYYSHVMNNRPPNMEVQLNDEIKKLFSREAQKRSSIPYLDSFSYDYTTNRLLKK